MSVSDEVRSRVRRRAGYVCEFCGVTESDTGGELTVDHFQPQSQGGADILDNLIYAYHRCNQYKLDYWPANPKAPHLWNPRTEPASLHFIETLDGFLQPLTATGAFTLARLRLNRPSLVAHRQQKHVQAEESRLLTQYKELIELHQQLNRQLSVLIEEQSQLLAEQRELLRLLLHRGDSFQV